ncbi:MAG: hypothetical protein KDH15_09445 [Rhodocyclaceae bacterium]|nr:hypothetical protein [Rhodocyclaceae bacterium]
MPDPRDKFRPKAGLASIDDAGAGRDPERDAWLGSLRSRRPEEAVRLIDERLNMLQAAQLGAAETIAELGMILHALTGVLARHEAARIRDEIAVAPFEADLVGAFLMHFKRIAAWYLEAAEAVVPRWYRRSQDSVYDVALIQGATAVLHRIELAHRVYARSSPSAWRLLCRFTKMALARGGDDGEYLQTEIERLHARALLFELADPNRLRPAASELLRAYLKRHGPLARIVQSRSLSVDDRRQPGVYVLDCDGRRVRRAASGSRGEPAAGALVLDARQLLARLERQRAGLAAGVDPARLGLPREARQPDFQDFLKGLASRWQGRRGRKHSRNRFLPRATVAVGFEEVLARLGARRTGTRPTAADATDRWLIINESAAGFGLSQLASPPRGIRVGDLCCVQADGRAELHLGLIRRAQFRSPHSSVLGIELIGSNGERCEVIDPSRDGHARDAKPVIRVGRLPGRTTGSGLICSAGDVGEGEPVLLVSADGTRLARVAGVAPVANDVDLVLLEPEP